MTDVLPDGVDAEDVVDELGDRIGFGDWIKRKSTADLAAELADEHGERKGHLDEVHNTLDEIEREVFDEVKIGSPSDQPLELREELVGIRLGNLRDELEGKTLVDDVVDDENEDTSRGYQ